MEKQGLPGEGSVDDAREKRVSVPSRGLAERREHLAEMELMFCRSTLKVQRELQGMREIFKGLEEEQASWRRERESLEGELCKLRSEVERLQAALAASAPPRVCDVDRGSEEIDLRSLAEHKWLERRQVLAPITPEAVRARVPVGKENIRSNGEETQRLRLENERLREKASKLSKENKGLKSQYNFLLSMDRSGSRGDVGQLTSNHDQLQAALENGLEKPSKIRRRSPVEAQAEGGDVRLPSLSSDTNAPSTPLPPQTVAEIVTDPTASTSGSKVKAEPVQLEFPEDIPQIPSTRDNTAGGPDAGFERKPDRATDNSGMQHCPLLVGVFHCV
jgi:regulator of replication initiation timing